MDTISTYIFPASDTFSEPLLINDPKIDPSVTHKDSHSDTHKDLHSDDFPQPLLMTLWSYDESAEEYEENVKDYVPQNEIDEFANQLPFRAEVLDIGCGTGRDAQIFCKKGFKVTGIDFSPNMIKIARRTALSAKFHLMDIMNMNFEKQSFDGVWANCSLLHIPKEKMICVLRKIYYILKIHGIFSLVLKEGEGQILKKDIRYLSTDKPKFWVYYSEKDIRDLLDKTRFKIVSLKINRPGNYVSEPLMHIFAIKLRSASL